MPGGYNVAYGQIAFVQLATLTRPANTVAYTAGQLVGQSLTAGQCVAMQWPAAARVPNGSGQVRRVRVKKSTSTTGGVFRIHLFNSAPAFTTIDGGALTGTVPESGWVGYADVTVAQGFSDSAKGVTSPALSTLEMNFITVGGAGAAPFTGGMSLYGLIEARTAYTPGSAEVFSVELEIWQN